MGERVPVALRELEQAVVRFSGQFDPVNLDQEQLPATVDLLGRLERTLGALGSLAAARLCSTTAGHHSTGRRLNDNVVAGQCARAWGVGVPEALQAVETGRRVIAQPQILEAMIGGQLSRRQADLVSKAAERDPGATEYLLYTAARRPLKALARECERAAQHRDRGRGPQLGAAHGTRALRSWTDRQGQWHLSARGSLSDGEKVLAALQPLAHELAEEARLAGRPGGPEACAFDALVSLAEARLGDVPAGPPASSRQTRTDRHRTPPGRRQAARTTGVVRPARGFYLPPGSLDWLVGSFHATPRPPDSVAVRTMPAEPPSSQGAPTGSTAVEVLPP